MDGKSASRTCTACGMAGIALNHKCRSPSTTPDVDELRKMLAEAMSDLHGDDSQPAVVGCINALPGLLDDVAALRADRELHLRNFNTQNKEMERLRRLESELINNPRSGYLQAVRNSDLDLALQQMHTQAELYIEERNTAQAEVERLRRLRQPRHNNGHVITLQRYKDRIDKALDVSIANCTNLKDVLVAVANIRAALTGEDQ